MKFKLIFCSATFALLSFIGNSQDSTDNSKWSPTGELSVIFRNSLSIPTINNDFGETEFELVGGLTHSFRLGYQLNLPYNLGITARAGFGFSSIVFWDDFYDSVVWPQKPRNYFTNVTYNLYTSLELGVSYKYNLNNKFDLTTTLGAGFNFSNSYGWGSSIGNGFGRETRMNWDYNNNRKPFLFCELGIAKTLKNQNRLSLSLAYEYSFDPIYSGDYEVYQDNLLTSNGTFFNSGNNLGINLAYTFTGEKQRQVARNNAAKNKSSFLSEKNKLKKEKRFIHPRSIFIGVGGGLFRSKNSIADNDSPFGTVNFSSLSAQLFAQVGFKKDFFYEVGISLDEYIPGFSFKEIEGSGSGTVYPAARISGGFGKRFIHKPSNIKIINVQAGLGVIITGNSKRTIPSRGTYGGQFKPDYKLEYEVIFHFERFLSPTLFIVLEKDFQLSKSLLFSLRYRYDQGLLPIYIQDISYIENGVAGETQNLVYGTGRTFGFALKYKFLQKKYRENEQ